MVGWLVGWLVRQFSQKWLIGFFWFFCMKLGDYKGRKVTELHFLKNYLICRYLRKGLQTSPKSDFDIFLKNVSIFLVFGLKLVLNMTFNLNETYFSEKLSISGYLTSELSKYCPNWSFGHFLDFEVLVFLDFPHNDRWARFVALYKLGINPIITLDCMMSNGRTMWILLQIRGFKSFIKH